MKRLLVLAALALALASAAPAPTVADTGPPAICAGSLADAPVRVPATSFVMGSDRYYPEEGPPTETQVAAFDIDAHEVTNRQFAAFVAATGYRTEAEGPGGGAFVFVPPATPVPLDPRLWWRYVRGADWRHPSGPDSNIAGRDNDPVVNVTHEDAAAYARWAGRALPSEEQFEAAARAGVADPDAQPNPDTANFWQGEFPNRNAKQDGFSGRAPAGCFRANGVGAYDLIGNVWEWTGSWYLPSHAPFVTGDGSPGNPSFDPAQPGVRARVIKGGSYLCASNYCARYRPAARHAQDETLAASHLGFRTVSAPRPRG